ncbi:MAG: hypothetical protein ACRCX2_30235 [Paraclostridium sp.]
MDKAPIQATAKYTIKKFDQDGVFLGEETFEEVLSEEATQELIREGLGPDAIN